MSERTSKGRNENGRVVSNYVMYGLVNVWYLEPDWRLKKSLNSKAMKRNTECP